MSEYLFKCHKEGDGGFTEEKLEVENNWRNYIRN